MESFLSKKQSKAAVTIGSSAGGLVALRIILTQLPADFPLPIFIVQHLDPHSDNFMAKYFNELCKIEVKEADEKEKALPGVAYISPANYHMLIEKNGTISFTVDSKVNYARPSVDVLFESAADVYKENLIGVILTGANRDGSQGLKKIVDNGGIAIVQDPNTAEADSMPRSAIKLTKVNYVLPLEEIGLKLIELVKKYAK